MPFMFLTSDLQSSSNIKQILPSQSTVTEGSIRNSCNVLWLFPILLNLALAVVGDGFKNMQILIDLNSKYLPGILNPLDHILHLPSNVVWSNIPTFASPTKLFAWETIFIVFMVLSFAMCTQNVFSQMQEQRFREMVIFGTSSPVYISQSWKSTKVWFLALAPRGDLHRRLFSIYRPASFFSLWWEKIVFSFFIFWTTQTHFEESFQFCFKWRGLADVTKTHTVSVGGRPVFVVVTICGG